MSASSFMRSCTVAESLVIGVTASKEAPDHAPPCRALPAAALNDLSRRHIAPDLCLDARRVLFLTDTRTLVIADLHLGYAWAHRHAGNLLPVTPGEEALGRMERLLEAYAPRELVLLGDIVHRAVPVAELKAMLRDSLCPLGKRVQLRLVAGNHDRRLGKLLAECGVETELVREVECGPHLLAHGDEADADRAAELRERARSRGGRVIIGHEHPAVTVSDFVAMSAKCPCFLVGEAVLVLPAFSAWAAGSDARAGRWMSPFAQGESFPLAVAVLAGKLLPVRL